MTNTFYFDMDGVLANFHKAFATNKGVALNRKAMANLEPFTENVAVVRSLIANGSKVYILTAAANENGKQGKMDWLKKYIPEMVEENILVIVGHGKKVDYIREDGMLIDDDEKNLKPWAKAGHPTYLVANKGEKIAL